MNTAYFRFYEELNDFLPPGKRKKQFPYSFNDTPAVKDSLEALGIPHVEVDLILVNGQSVNFSHKIKNGDFISVYPVFESLDITPVTHLREKPLREIKFFTDVHLGKLTKYLRLCGFNTLYRKDNNDQMFIDLAVTDKRVILTRSSVLLKYKKVTHGYCIRSMNSREQLNEVVKRFDLKKLIHPFTRCIECNGLLMDVTKKEILSRLLPKTRQFYRKFKMCHDCKRVYWNGSHYLRMKEQIKTMNK